ncbi:hypothetical protein CEXT_635941 [Caerostris extrusa]|uniref:Uncharacterized protein n=1 Tax=Caerostris extrusa TaxID=172846 RepID=A0AAV4RE09_CAEEX|nr:hypothetical protein CEXT_635941 [Caerostris extrusa]
MKFTLVAAFALLLCAVSLEARKKWKWEKFYKKFCISKRSQKKNQVLKVTRKKNPFPLFKSCEAFNRGYAITLREMKKNKEIWFKNCEEEDLELCVPKDMSSARCSVPEEPTEECRAEINEFLEGAACGGREENADRRNFSGNERRKVVLI